MESELQPEGTGLSIAEYWSILRRRRMIILQSTILIGLVGMIVVFLMPSVFSASARLVIEQPSVGVNNIDPSNPLSSILALSPVQDVETQVAILQSPSLQARALSNPSVSKIVVKQEDETHVIDVTAYAHTRTTARNAANALANDFISYNHDNGVTEIKNSLLFAQAQQQVAHQTLINAEKALEVYKRIHQIPELAEDIDLKEKKAAGLIDQVDLGKANLESLRAQIETTKELLKKEPATTVFSLATTNPDVATTEATIAGLKADRKAMTQKGGFTETAPQIVAIDARTAELERQIKAMPATRPIVSEAPNNINGQLRASLATLEAQQTAAIASLQVLRRALARTQEEIAAIPQRELDYDSLVRNYNTADTEDKDFTAKVEDLSLRAQAYHASAHILESASDTELVRPKKLLGISLSCALGLLIGICLALLQEMLDDRINSTEETGRLLRLPSLGAIPTIAEGSPQLLLEMAGSEPAAESYRSVRTNIYFASVDTALETLLVTSPNPGEGKSTTATNIALAMALDGKRVILVDADLRRSTLHKVLGMLAVPGLTDVLLGHTSLDEALQECELASNLQLLPAGSVPPNPSEMLNSRSFANIVQRLVSKADVVVFDSPPVLIGADASILASQVDGTLLVLEAGATKKQAASQAVSMLRQARARLIGAAFNKTSGAHGYYYYSHYSHYGAGNYAAIDESNGSRKNKGKLRHSDERSKLLTAPSGDDEL